MAHQPERIDVILHIAAHTPMPPNFASTFKNSVVTALDSWGITVLVNPDTMVTSLIQIVTRIMPDVEARYPSTKTIEEAYQLICQHRKQ